MSLQVDIDIDLEFSEFFNSKRYFHKLEDVDNPLPSRALCGFLCTTFVVDGLKKCPICNEITGGTWNPQYTSRR